MNFKILVLKLKYSFFLTKALRKVCELFLCSVSKFKTRKHRDPSFLLTHCLTQSQHRALEALYKIEKTAPKKFSSIGEKSFLRCSVIIPFRDKWHLTQACLKSLLAQSLEGISLQVILVDNGSSQQDTQTELSCFLSDARVAWGIVRVDEPFNFSRLNNIGVEKTRAFEPHFLLFLNNDIELKSENIIQSILNFKQKMGEAAGAVGCTLLYPNQTIQHLFLAPGVKIAAGHPLKGIPFQPDMEWFQSPRPVAAVTGAFMCVSVSQFQKAGGFCELLATGYQDLDLCLKFQRDEMSNWVLPHLLCIHHENATRARAHNWREIQIVYERWGIALKANPYFSRFFTRESENIALKLFKCLPKKPL